MDGESHEASASAAGSEPAEAVSLRDSLICIGALLLALLSLATAVSTTLASILRHAPALAMIGRLGEAERERVIAFDSLYWAPGLFAICLFSIKDRARRSTYAVFALALAALMGMDAVDDVRVSGVVGELAVWASLAEVALNLLLLITFWVFVRNWPARLDRSSAQAANLRWFKIPGLKRYFLWSLDSKVLPALLAAACVAPKLAMLAAPASASPIADTLSFLALFLVMAHLAAPIHAAFALGSKSDRRRIYWVLLALTIFGAYSLATTIIETLMGWFGGGILNYVYIAVEWITYAAILACLASGSLFDNLIRPTPILRATILYTISIPAFGFLVLSFGHYGWGRIEEMLGRFRLGNEPIRVFIGTSFTVAVHRVVTTFEHFLIHLVPEE